MERFGICLHLRTSLLIELLLLVLTIVGLPVIIDCFVALIGSRVLIVWAATFCGCLLIWEATVTLPLPIDHLLHLIDLPGVLCPSILFNQIFGAIVAHSD